MADRMHLDPADLTAFNSKVENPKLVMSDTLPAGCGGAGLAECANLHAALQRASSAARAFLSDVDQGFTSFKTIATACQNDYNANDAESTSRLEQVKTSLNGAS